MFAKFFSTFQVSAPDLTMAVTHIEPILEKLTKAALVKLLFNNETHMGV